MIWGLVKAYWMQILGAVLLVGLLLVVKHWHDRAALVPGLQQQVKNERDARVKYETDMTRELARTRAVSKGVQDELKTLQDAATAAGAVPVVRCVRYNRPTAAVPSGGAAGPVGDAAATGAGELPKEAGPDIGPDLYALADRADALVAACRGAQAYIRGLPAAVPQ